MSYQVLARKWRPATFDQLVGQSHVLHALTNALSQQRLHHAYLFTGTRGVGKTSIARLFAKGLNCETGITAHPCGKCASCEEIAQGRFVDLIEVDAASRTKVDDTRELLDNVQYRPTRGRFKVYLIDEVHMLSRSSFNALLKTLEEPPEHVKFLLATTDPQKLPITVLSRCLQFNLKSLGLEDINAQLEHVLTQEKLPFEKQALSLLAKAANGSMRDALSLTDQAIAFGAGQVMTHQVRTMLGSIDEQQVVVLLNALLNGDIANLMQMTAQILSFGADADEVLRSLLELLHQIALTQFAPAAAQLSAYSEEIRTFSKQLSAEQVQLYYQILLTGRKDLPHAADPKSGLEMALLRAVAFLPEPPTNNWKVHQQDVGSSQDEVKKNAELKPVSSSQTATQDPEDTAELESKSIQTETNTAGIVSYAPVAVSNATESSLMEASVQSIPEQVPPHQSANKESVNQDEDASLGDEILAEQSLILSQAQSMGYQEDPIVLKDISPEPVVLESSNTSTDLADDLASYEQYLSQADGTDTSVSDMAEMRFKPSSLISSLAPLVPQADNIVFDDLLDAVLASRDSLLSSIKPPETEPQTLAIKMAPVRQPEPSKPIDSGVIADSPVALLPQEPVSVPQVSHQRQIETVEYLQSQVEINTPDNDDRPPWESAPVSTDSLVDDSSTEPYFAVEEVDPQGSNGVEPVVEPSEIISTQVEPEAVNTHLPALPSLEITGDPLDLHWYKQISAMPIRGRVHQLAANAVCLQWGKNIELLLKPDQKHLAAPTALAQLKQAIIELVEHEISVDIMVGTDENRETPREVRLRFHQELLAQAKNTLFTDENIRWLTQFMGAELNEDSLDYAKELLAAKGQQIPKLEAS